MSILLLILKIIGWVLLSVVLLILLLLLIVLFWHAQYKGNFECGEDLSPAKVVFKAGWLLNILQFFYKYENGQQECYYKIFGIKKALPDKNNKSDKKYPSKDNKQTSQIKDSTSKKKHKNKHKKQKSEEHPSLKERFIQFKEQLTNPSNRNAFLIFMKELKYICKHWGPRKFKADFAFSLGDPAYTGILLGIISVFPVAYKRDVVLKSDFESDKIYLLGHAMFKGRVRLIHLVKVIFAVFFNEDSRNFVSTLTKK